MAGIGVLICGMVTLGIHLDDIYQYEIKMFTIFLPIGIAFIIEQLVDLSGMPGGLTGLIILLTAVEGGLIVFKVYPKVIKLSSRNRLNALIFYLGVNLISRVLVLMYAVWMLGNALSSK